MKNGQMASSDLRVGLEAVDTTPRTRCVLSSRAILLGRAPWSLSLSRYRLLLVVRLLPRCRQTHDIQTRMSLTFTIARAHALGLRTKTCRPGSVQASGTDSSTSIEPWSTSGRGRCLPSYWHTGVASRYEPQWKAESAAGSFA